MREMRISLMEISGFWPAEGAKPIEVASNEGHFFGAGPALQLAFPTDRCRDGQRTLHVNKADGWMGTCVFASESISMLANTFGNIP